MQVPNTTLPSESAGPIAAELERLQSEEAELSQEYQALWRDGTERRQNGATMVDIAPINERLWGLGYQLHVLSDRILELDLEAENERNGWTRLADGNYGKVLPNGQVLSASCWVSEWTDSDGTVYRDTAEDERRRREDHKAVALAFKAQVAEQRLANARRLSVGARPPRPGRVTVLRRSRPAARSNSTSRGDPPDDPDPEPPNPTRASYLDVAGRLEALARKPLAPHRFELRMLAGRLRAFDQPRAPVRSRDQPGQLDLFEAAA